MWCRVVLVRTDVSEECIASISRVKRISELGTTLAITSNFLHSVLQLLVIANVFRSSLILFTLMMEAIRSSETVILSRATRHYIPEDNLLLVHFNFQNVFICTFIEIMFIMFTNRRSQCPSGIRLELSSSALLRSWIQILLQAWMLMCPYSVFMLSCL
jgi:hypothetical protein